MHAWIHEQRQRLEAAERDGEELAEKLAGLEGEKKAQAQRIVALEQAVADAQAATAKAKASAGSRRGSVVGYEERGDAATQRAMSLAFSSHQAGAQEAEALGATTEGKTAAASEEAGDEIGEGKKKPPPPPLPLQLPPSPSSSPPQAPSSSPPEPSLSLSASAGDASSSGAGAGGLEQSYVVIQQLQRDFQAERSRDLQLLAKLQQELASLHAEVARLQEQERGLKVPTCLRTYST